MQQAHMTWLALAVCMTVAAGAQDWPQWRGPNRDGIATPSPKLLDAWPTNGAGPKLLWKSDPVGAGQNGGGGSVTVADGKAFVFAHARKLLGKQVAVTARDLEEMGWRDDLPAALGKDIWRKEFPAVLPQEADFGASGTPAIADGKCYAAGSAGMYCLSVTDGSVVWQARIRFSNSSPLVLNGAVYAMVPEATAFDERLTNIPWQEAHAG